jgi:hypothetical protein
MPIKKKHDSPYARSEVGAWDPVDAKYDAAVKKLRDVEEDLSEVVVKCLIVTSRRLLAGAHLFDSSDDRELGQLVKSLRAFNVLGTREALSDFLRANPYPSNQGPEAIFIYACMAMQDALSYREEGRHEESHRASVTCRSSLAKLGIS